MKRNFAESAGRGNSRRSLRIKDERETIQDLPPMRTMECKETGGGITSSSSFTVKRVFCTLIAPVGLAQNLSG